jgi:hypothetical protein
MPGQYTIIQKHFLGRRYELYSRWQILKDPVYHTDLLLFWLATPVFLKMSRLILIINATIVDSSGSLDDTTITYWISADDCRWHLLAISISYFWFNLHCHLYKSWAIYCYHTADLFQITHLSCRLWGYTYRTISLYPVCGISDGASGHQFPMHKSALQIGRFGLI